MSGGNETVIGWNFFDENHKPHELLLRYLNFNLPKFL